MNGFANKIPQLLKSVIKKLTQSIGNTETLQQHAAQSLIKPQSATIGEQTEVAASNLTKSIIKDNEVKIKNDLIMSKAEKKMLYKQKAAEQQHKQSDLVEQEFDPSSFKKSKKQKQQLQQKAKDKKPQSSINEEEFEFLEELAPTHTTIKKKNEELKKQQFLDKKVIEVKGNTETLSDGTKVTYSREADKEMTKKLFSNQSNLLPVKNDAKNMIPFIEVLKMKETDGKKRTISEQEKYFGLQVTDFKFNLQEEQNRKEHNQLKIRDSYVQNIDQLQEFYNEETVLTAEFSEQLEFQLDSEQIQSYIKSQTYKGFELLQHLINPEMRLKHKDKSVAQLLDELLVKAGLHQQLSKHEFSQLQQQLQIQEINQCIYLLNYHLQTLPNHQQAKTQGMIQDFLAQHNIYRMLVTNYHRHLDVYQIYAFFANIFERLGNTKSALDCYMHVIDSVVTGRSVGYVQNGITEDTLKAVIKQSKIKIYELNDDKAKIAQDYTIHGYFDSKGHLQESQLDYEIGLLRHQMKEVYDQYKAITGFHPIALNTIGTFYEKHRNYKRAVQAYQESLELQQKMGIPKNTGFLHKDTAFELRPLTLELLANVHYKLKNYDDAIKYYQNSLYYIQLGTQKDYENIASVKQSLGVVYTECQLPHEAIKVFKDAIQDLNQVEDFDHQVGIKLFASNLANLHSLLAYQYYKTANTEEQNKHREIASQLRANVGVEKDYIEKFDKYYDINFYGV